MNKTISGDEYKNYKTQNRKVRNAQKQYDEHGKKIADSKWELNCLRIMQYEGLDNFETQKEFELLPTIRSNCLERTLSKRKWCIDFVFEDLKIVADSKGFTTEVARLKRHIFLHRYPDWEVYFLKDRRGLMNFIYKVKQKRGEK